MSSLIWAYLTIFRPFRTIFAVSHGNKIFHFCDLQLLLFFAGFWRFEEQEKPSVFCAFSGIANPKKPYGIWAYSTFWLPGKLTGPDFFTDFFVLRYIYLNIMSFSKAQNSL